jgi:hypothetical protein
MDSDESWRWQQCRAFYKEYLRVDVRTDDVDSIVWMRNKTTHLRDEMKTLAGREEVERRLEEIAVSGPRTDFETRLRLMHDPFPMPWGVDLTPTADVSAVSSTSCCDGSFRSEPRRAGQLAARYPRSRIADSTTTVTNAMRGT